MGFWLIFSPFQAIIIKSVLTSSYQWMFATMAFWGKIQAAMSLLLDFPV